jgi:hypothetical protein
METGQQGIRVEDAAALLVVYGVIGAERGRLLAMAERHRERGWWETFGAGLTPWSRTFMRLESDAVRLVSWQPLLVPGLLQTSAYTMAVMSSAGVTGTDARDRVAARLGRQAILARDEPPELHVIMDEMVLRRVLGSRQVMARQLRHLAELAERPNITAQVVPLSVGGHTGLDGPFLIMDFARDASVVHLEHKMSSNYLEEPDHVAVFRREVDRLAEVALSPSESIEFVLRIAAEHEQR